MTRCEQKKNEMIPALAGELVLEGGVAKMEDSRNASPPNFPRG